jgi:hypothetical protein
MTPGVTLVVYAWKSVQPGTLAWSFPSLSTAVDAARAMTNAVGWAVVAGGSQMLGQSSPRALAKARADGVVLLEKAG